jgi:hypothetical protein
MLSKLAVVSSSLSLVSLVLLSASCTSAEVERYNCAKAIRIATAGYSGKKMRPALDQLLPCGASGADAAATALRSARAERDTAVLGRLTYPLLVGATPLCFARRRSWPRMRARRGADAWLNKGRRALSPLRMRSGV